MQVLVSMLSVYASAGSDSGEATIVFGGIYKNHVWGSGEAAGEGSGGGSSFEYTRGVRRILRHFIHKHNVTSMLDAPCGSFNWMPYVIKEFQGLTYNGYDAAFDVIQRVKDSLVVSALNANSTRVHFTAADLSQFVLPNSTDLIFSRDAFQHLPLVDIHAILKIFKQADPRFVMIGSYPRGVNHRIPMGQYFQSQLCMHVYAVMGRQGA